MILCLSILIILLNSSLDNSFGKKSLTLSKLPDKTACLKSVALVPPGEAKTKPWVFSLFLKEVIRLRSATSSSPLIPVTA